jgi:hypothetical protein
MSFIKRGWAVALLGQSVALLGIFASCSDDSTGGGGATTDDAGGGADQATTLPDTSAPADAATDQQVVGEGGGPDGGVPTTLAKVNATFGELVEGLAVLNGVPLVSLAPLGKVVQVLGDGGTPDYAAFGSATDFFTLGLTTDGAGNLFIGVAQTGPTPTVLPGIYKVAPGGGVPVAYAVPDALNPFGFINGLEFIGTDLFATDSQGKIFKVTNAGVTSLWLEADQLAGDEQDCKLGNGFPIGANGIAHDADNIYVVNTDKGTLLKIASTGGTAGAITLLKKDPELCGADGMTLDKDGSFLVAVNAKDQVVRVTPAGAISTVYKGPPLDSPASVLFEGTGAARRLLITNAAFKSSQTDGGKPAPSLVSLPLPN